MPTRTILVNKVQKGETFKLVSTVKNELGAALDLTAVTSAKLSYYHALTPYAAINSRNDQDITGGNQHTLESNGTLTWKGTTSDTNFAQTVDTDVVARYTYVYNDAQSVARTGIHEVKFSIEALPTVS